MAKTQLLDQLKTQLLDKLKQAFIRADYTLDAVLERIGDRGEAGLSRNSTIPLLDKLSGATDPQASLIKLFICQRQVPANQLAQAFNLAAMSRLGLIEVYGNQAKALVDVRPYGFEEPDGGEFAGWVASDLQPGLDRKTQPTRPDYVLGISPASTSLAQMTVPDQVDSALDLGTGSGVQCLHLAKHAKRLVATDLNPRAIELAEWTLRLSGISADLRLGSLYEPVEGEKFDLIVTNPPYVMSPPSDERLIYREGNFTGDGLVEKITREAVHYLNPGGRLQVLANWAILKDQDWQERIAEWASGTGCDLWVLERERLDPYAYIEMWLADAGLEGSPDWEPRYQQWLKYFADLGIEGVGMGWITLVNAGRKTPEIRVESWPYEIHQPVGPAISKDQANIDLVTKSDAEILASRLRLSEDVVEERTGTPGAADPEYIVLRQTTGLKRAKELDTAMAGILGACDGELSLGQIIAAVRQLLDLDETATDKVLSEVRKAIRDGYFSTD